MKLSIISTSIDIFAFVCVKLLSVTKTRKFYLTADIFSIALNGKKKYFTKSQIIRFLEYRWCSSPQYIMTIIVINRSSKIFRKLFVFFRFYIYVKINMLYNTPLVIILVRDL